jgi:integrase
VAQLRLTDDRKVRSFTRPEALRFLEAAEQHRLYALWVVAMAMGLRHGEALGLAWADVDLEEGAGNAIELGYPTLIEYASARRHTHTPMACEINSIRN